MRKPSLTHEKLVLKDRLDEYRAYAQMEMLVGIIGHRAGCMNEVEPALFKIRERKTYALTQVLIASRIVGEVPEVDGTLDGVLFEHALTDYAMYDHAEWNVVAGLFPIEAGLLSRLKGKEVEYHAAKRARDVYETAGVIRREYEAAIDDLKAQVAAWKSRFEELDPLEQLGHLPSDTPRKPQKRSRRTHE